MNLEQDIEMLQAINMEIARLTIEKEQLTKDIIVALGHEKEGEKTYNVGVWKVKAKTPFIYSLDTKAYKNGDFFLPAEFDPIKQSVSYAVDKKLFDKYYNSSPIGVRESLTQLITIKPGKAGLNIEARS